MDISVMIEGQMGLTWARWRRIIDLVEGSGFAGLFRSDHFTGANPPDADSLETWISLAYLADHSERIHFGQLVSPVSFRDPVMMARQAMQIDDLSGGRMYLGLGAGWQAREHQMFGYTLGSVKERMDRLQEAAELISLLTRQDEPVDFQGRYYNVRQARLLPRPKGPGPKILIGGNGMRRTLPLVAKFADAWNGSSLTPDAFIERSKHLDTLLDSESRPHEAVRRTVMAATFFGESHNQVELKLGPFKGHPAFEGKPIAEIIETMNQNGMIAGTSSEVKEQLAKMAEAGVDEVMLQWFDLDEIDRLEELAKAVL